MNKFYTPVLGVSRCLGFDACRYDGQIFHIDLVEALQPFCKVVTVCPEVDAGLTIPRKAVQLKFDGNNRYLIQRETEKDITKKVEEIAKSWLSENQNMDGMILKGRSPSCGVKAVKMYDMKKGYLISAKNQGLFPELVLKKKPAMLLEEEGRLTNAKLRDHFLARLFIQAEFRSVMESPSVRKLVAFQEKHKLLQMRYNQREQKVLGRIVANARKETIQDSVKEYNEHLQYLWRNPPRCGSVINVLLHAFGYFKKVLKAPEKAYFLDLLDDYKESKIPLSVVTHVLQTWILHYDVSYLKNQSFFMPYPPALISRVDSGKPDNCSSIE